MVESRGSVAARLPSGIFISQPTVSARGNKLEAARTRAALVQRFPRSMVGDGFVPFHPMSEYGSNACSAWGPLRCQRRLSIELWKD